MPLTINSGISEIWQKQAFRDFTYDFTFISNLNWAWFRHVKMKRQKNSEISSIRVQYELIVILGRWPPFRTNPVLGPNQTRKKPLRLFLDFLILDGAQFFSSFDFNRPYAKRVPNSLHRNLIKFKLNKQFVHLKALPKIYLNSRSSSDLVGVGLAKVTCKNSF